jgi:SAM-dependent methyltransferase
VDGSPSEVRPASVEEADANLAGTLEALDGATNYADWIVSLLEPHLGRDILEVGAGHGTLTERLARHGRTVTATEISPRCVRELTGRYGHRPDVTIIGGDLDAVDGRGPFDSAVLVNVLEHIADDGAALERLHTMLRPQGTLLVWVPAFEQLYSEFDRLVGHHRRYRKDGLRTTVEAAGFDVLDLRYVNSLGAVAWWVFARQLRQIPTRPWSVRLYDRVATPVLRRVETRWAPPFGQSVLCAARVASARPA